MSKEEVINGNESEVTTEGDNILVRGKPFTGLLIDSYDNGEKRYEMHCRDGRLHGIIKVYYENGKLFMEGEYSNGKRNGTESYYDQGGFKIYDIFYIYDRKTQRIEYYKSGNKKSLKNYRYVSKYSDDVPHGEERHWDEKGTLIDIYNWSDGLPDN